MRDKISRYQTFLLTALLTGLFMGVAPAAFAQLRISSNPHYFKNGSTVLPLVGSSADFLPHVTRSTKQNDLVTLESYPSFINELQARGLNTMQLVVDLNHSIGLAVDGRADPYPAEQPFFWNGSRWRLDRYEPAFFTNLRNVVDYARSHGVFVEVTLFDSWSEVDINNDAGSSPTSPWSVGRNIWYDSSGVQHTNAHFKETRHFISFDQGTTDGDQNNIDARALQLKLIQKTVAELNQYTNFYWQIANEPDFNYTETQPDLNITAMINWHNWVSQQIVSAEATLPNKHEIGVNFISKAALDLKGNLPPSIKIVNGHYVDVTGSPARYGAITAARNNTFANRLFGFNEGRATPNPTDRMSARAEAWEFMLTGGGLYDHFGLQWNIPDDRLKTCADPAIGIPTQVRCDLGKIVSFLAPLNLVSMVRQTDSKPSWITSGVVDYGADDPLSGGTGPKKTYWGAMQVTGSQYVFYYHHSNMSTLAAGTRYIPVPGSYSRNFTFNLAGAATGYYYKLEWFYYSPGSSNVQSTSIGSLLWNGSAVTKTTPLYNYDLALRMTRCPTLGVNCA